MKDYLGLNQLIHYYFGNLKEIRSTYIMIQGFLWTIWALFFATKDFLKCLLHRDSKVVWYPVQLFNKYISTLSNFFQTGIRFITQWTVDNNLGLDRLAGLRALDSNNCRQPTLSLHDLCLKFLTAHGTAPVCGQGIPPTHTINVAHLT